jgi:ABC-type nickel/cobalt efflux system permease component RcnA
MNDHRHDHPHDHGHDHSPGHGDTHGIVDPSITTSDRGLWAIKWSFVGLAATAALQLFVVFISSSVALRIRFIISVMPRPPSRLRSHSGLHGRSRAPASPLAMGASRTWPE